MAFDDAHPEIRANTDNQREAGNRHNEMRDYLAAIPNNHEEILAWAQSLGPVYAEFAEELKTMLDDRAGFYADAAATEDQLGTGLHKSAAMFEAHEDHASSQIAGTFDA